MCPMRELICPTLFVIARTGLFLAVVTWVVSRWWVLNVQGYHMRLTSKPHAWTLRIGPWWPDPFRFQIMSTAFSIDGGNDSTHWGHAYWGANPNERNTFWCGFWIHSTFEIHWRFPPARFRVMVSHGLNVAVFTIFYGVLKWRSRKLGTDVQRE